MSLMCNVYNYIKENNQILQFKDLSIDTDKIQVCLNGKKIKLTNKEFKLIRMPDLIRLIRS